MIDPRIPAIDSRFESVKRIISVVSGKGGVGKTLISVVLALELSKKGYRVGLLDLDFSGASDHLVLGAPKLSIPEESYGIVPPLIHGIRFMSIIYYAENNPLPLRGNEISNALIELLTITRWGKLDYLVIDVPPGLGDQLLDLIRFLKRGEFLIVTTPSKLSINVVEKLIKLLLESKCKIIGIIENMKLNDEKDILMLTKRYNMRYLIDIQFYKGIENKNRHKINS